VCLINKSEKQRAEEDLEVWKVFIQAGENKLHALYFVPSGAHWRQIQENNPAEYEKVCPPGIGGYPVNLKEYERDAVGWQQNKGYACFWTREQADAYIEEAVAEFAKIAEDKESPATIPPPIGDDNINEVARMYAESSFVPIKMYIPGGALFQEGVIGVKPCQNMEALQAIRLIHKVEEPQL
jgi:hypothetical protein